MKSNGEEKRSRLKRTEIIVALITVVGVLGGALFANWDKVFPPGGDDPTPASSNTPARTPTTSSVSRTPATQPSLQEQTRRITSLQYRGLEALKAGRLSEASNLFEEADKILQRAEEQSPRDVALLELRGYMWKNWALISRKLQRNDDTERYLENAARTFKQVLNRRPTDAAYNGLGSVYIMQGDLESAEREIRNALRLNPNYAAAKHDLELVQRLRNR